MTDAPTVAFVGMTSLVGSGSGVDPALQEMMAAMVDGLRTEMLKDFEKLQLVQEADSDRLDDGALSMLALQQEVATLRMQNQSLQARGGSTTVSGSVVRVQALEKEVTGLTTRFEAEKKDIETWRRALDGPGGIIVGLEAAIDKGVKRSKDDVVTLGGESFAVPPDVGAFVSAWKPEAWGCVVQKKGSCVGWVFDGARFKGLRGATDEGRTLILKEHSAYVGPQQTGIKFEVEKGMDRVIAQVRSRIKFFFADGSAGKAVCDDALIASVSQVFDQIEVEHASGRDTRGPSAIVWAIFA
eukprot:scaffold13409_cov58-Attheya_sp.AAC.2